MNARLDRLLCRVTLWYLSRAAARLATTGRSADARVAAVIPIVQRTVRRALLTAVTA